MSIYTKLLEIQQSLNAPKNQHNSFGNYNYRSAEDILAAVKPLLQEQECILLLSDDVVEVGSGTFIKATATIIDIKASGPIPNEDKTHDTGYVSVTAWARHPEQRKGMDESQMTGTASSYARKYALNGLFAIDDVKDADALPPAKPTEKTKSATDKGNEGNGAVSCSGGPKKRSKELQVVFEMTQLLSTLTGEKPGTIAAKLESYIGHPVNEDLNAAHYARIHQWFREQGVDDEA